MRLISCYIEGYGKIKGETFTFERGLTSFLWINGEGKTTLASFLKAMLYGLERKSTKEFRDREHFFPFDGRRFGGNLIVEANGKEYRIERFFDEKSEARDSLTVYEDGSLMKNVPEDLGKYLLGVDRESFDRTLFLRHEDLEISSTTGIHDRLNQFLEGGEEEGGLDIAMKELEKRAKGYKNQTIPAEKAHIEKLDVEIANATSVRNALKGKYEKEKTLQTSLFNAQAEQDVAQKQREKSLRFEHYDSLVEQVQVAKKKVAEIQEKYPCGVPSEEETNAFNEYMGTSNTLQTKIESALLSEQEEGRLALLSARFEGDAPDENVLLEKGAEITRLSKLYAEGQEKIGGEKERALEEKFCNRKPTAEEIETIENRLEEYKRKRSEALSTPAFTQGGAPVKGAAKKYGILAVFAALLATAGLILLAMDMLFFGAALAVGGGLGLFAVGFLYLNKKSSGQTLAIENPLRASADREAAALEWSVRSLLAPFGYGEEESVELGVEKLKNALADYDEWLIVKENAAKSAESRRREIADLETSLLRFFSRYGVEEGDFIERLSVLRVALSEWKQLASRKADGEKNCQRAREEFAALKGKMAAYREKYGLLVVDCIEILTDIRDLAQLAEKIADGEQAAALFKQENGLDDRTEIDAERAETLKEQIKGLQSELSKLQNEIRRDEGEVERLEELEREKKAATERWKEYKHKQKLLETTGTFLQKAAALLRKKYVAPVLEEFVVNAEVLEKTLGERVEITKDFELRFERNGVNRSEKHLSSGQRSICALCFRLALIKNMYREQAPFLVLDDPFVTLDEEHIGRVRGVLQALSKDMQLVYFTCHASRMI